MKGFTLIELVVTVSIVGILAAALLPLGQLSVKRMKEAELRAALREIRTALDAYKKATDEGRVEKIAETAGYPKSLDILVAGVPDMRDPKKRLLRFLRRIPRDPMNPDLEASSQETWGMRRYDSERYALQGGDDVVDGFSLSLEAGLNGVAYHEW